MKNQKANVLISLQLPNTLKERVEEKAKLKGMSFASFARDALTLYSDLNGYVSDEIEEIADRFDLDEKEVIQNIVIRYFAEQGAYNEVYGNTPRFPIEFLKTNLGTTLSGQDLIERLKPEFVAALKVLKKAGHRP